MSKVIRQGKNVNEEEVLGVFTKYLQFLGYPLRGYQELFQGKIIFQFLKLVKKVQQPKINQDQEIELLGSGMAIFKKIVMFLEDLEKCCLNHEFTSNAEINLFEICVENNKQQIMMLLIRIFKVAVQSSNKEYFIEVVMKLDSNSQQILAQFLKSSTVFKEFLSPQRDSKERVQKKETQEKEKSDEIQLIDKIYEFQQENQKLLNQIYQLQLQNNSLSESVSSLQKSLETVKIEGEEYRMLIVEYEEIIQGLRQKNESEKVVEKKNQNSEYVHRILKEHNEKEEILKVQNEGLKRKYENRIKDYNQTIKSERQKNKFLTNNMQMLKQEFHNLIGRCNETDEEIKQQNELVITLKQKNRELEDQIATLKFQLNYKDSQIEELKEVIMNASSTTNREDDSQFRKPMMLGDFTQPPPVSPRSMLKMDMEELKCLRLQVKELSRQLNSLKNLRTQNKELEYEKKKLLKILKEYEASRGQENEILNGCLYELRMRYKDLKNGPKQDSTSCQKSIN